MAEHAKSEESQRTEIPHMPPSALEQSAAMFGAPRARSGSFRFRVREVRGNPPDVTLVLEAKHREQPQEDFFEGDWEELPSIFERFEGASASEGPAQMDDAYYDEVRRAVGGGAPTVLLGTSTKSLERNLERLKKLQPREEPPPESDPPLKTNRTSLFALRAAIYFLAASSIYFAVTSAMQGSSSWIFLLFFIPSALIFLAAAAVMSLPKLRDIARGRPNLRYLPFLFREREDSGQSSEATKQSELLRIQEDRRPN